MIPNLMYWQILFGYFEKRSKLNDRGTKVAKAMTRNGYCTLGYSLASKRCNPHQKPDQQAHDAVYKQGFQEPNINTQTVLLPGLTCLSTLRRSQPHQPTTFYEAVCEKEKQIHPEK